MNDEMKYNLGDITTIAGRTVNILALEPEDIAIEELCYSLGRTLRYNGHIRHDWSPAQHAVVLSYVVPEEYALEALLHDVAEGYMGDIIQPIKELYPEIEQFERELAGTIINALLPDNKITSYDEEGVPLYKRSDVVREWDRKMFEHECFEFGDRPGIFHRGISEAWDKTIELHMEYFHAGWELFMRRYAELTGYERDEENEGWVWYRYPTTAMQAEELGLTVDEFRAMMESVDANTKEGT